MEFIYFTGAILLWGIIEFAVMAGIILLFIIWMTESRGTREYGRLKSLARRANDGIMEAQCDCENERLIKITQRWDKKYGHKKHYSVRRSALYACFGFY